MSETLGEKPVVDTERVDQALKQSGYELVFGWCPEGFAFYRRGGVHVRLWKDAFDLSSMNHADLLAILAQSAEPRFTVEEYLELAEEAIYKTKVDRGHGMEPPMVTAEIEQFRGHLRQLLQEVRP